MNELQKSYVKKVHDVLILVRILEYTVHYHTTKNPKDKEMWKKVLYLELLLAYKNKEVTEQKLNMICNGGENVQF